MDDVSPVTASNFFVVVMNIISVVVKSKMHDLVTFAESLFLYFFTASLG